MLVIRAGKLDSALHVLDKLQAKYPNEKGVFIAKIHAPYLKKDYERVINLIDRDVHFQDVLLPIKAQSLVKSNRFTEADSLYKFLISKTTDTDILIGYAELLVSQGNFLRAFEMYEKIVDAFQTQSNDSTTLAISLNNAAWAQMRSGKGSISTALKMSEKAYHLYSDEPRIIDTYTELLIKSKNVSKAIDVLHKSIESRNPRLLVRLADAYKINGQKRKAESLYRELLNLNDSILSVYSLSKESLNRKISR
jgi:tetratricopeptide (TPR) repeat protein